VTSKTTRGRRFGRRGSRRSATASPADVLTSRTQVDDASCSRRIRRSPRGTSARVSGGDDHALAGRDREAALGAVVATAAADEGERAREGQEVPLMARTSEQAPYLHAPSSIRA
jgi:hypothetical protein